MGVKSMRFPKIRTPEPPNNNRIPRPPIKKVNLHRDLFVISCSFISINLETNIELKKTATMREEPKTTERVIGK